MGRDVKWCSVSSRFNNFQYLNNQRKLEDLTTSQLFRPASCVTNHIAAVKYAEWNIFCFSDHQITLSGPSTGKVWEPLV